MQKAARGSRIRGLAFPSENAFDKLTTREQSWTQLSFKTNFDNKKRAGAVATIAINPKNDIVQPKYKGKSLII
jgi:hypothetical protein